MLLMMTLVLGYTQLNLQEELVVEEVYSGEVKLIVKVCQCVKEKWTGKEDRKSVVILV